MKKLLKSRVLRTGLAMFAMFFGAGNVVFPLAVGEFAQGGVWYAAIGLLLTAVGVPFLGLLSMTCYGGNLRAFFSRIGNIPGFLVALLILLLIGPLGAMPRTITLSYSTTKMLIPQLSLPLFSLVSCVVIYFCTIRKNRIIDMIGVFLTPLLLFMLTLIVIKGLWTAPTGINSSFHSLDMFLFGLGQGYKTMDLMGAFFFSTVIIESIQEGCEEKSVMSETVKSSCIGAALLGIVYLGFTLLAAHWSGNLAGHGVEDFLGLLAMQILGPYGGIVACIAVALACLTTAIALGAVCSEFIHLEILRDKISYKLCLISTLVVNFFVSILDFTKIMEMVAPILNVCYPALIVLSMLNIGYKLWGIQSVRIPTLIVFTLSVWSNLS